MQGVVRDKERYEATSKTQSVDEARDWSDSLNTLAREGFRVRDSGALQMGDNIVFWALLEKRDRQGIQAEALGDC
jgi:hypothetical protein